MTDKDWLRKKLPNATYDQEHDFIERVGMILENPEITEREARETALAIILGA